MKITAYLLALSLIMNSLSASELDPTRALKLTKPKVEQKSKDSNLKSSAKKIKLSLALTIPNKKQQIQAVQTFFHKNSETLYVHALGRKGADLLAISADKWYAKTKPALKMGQIYKNSQFFTYEPKNNEILGVSYQKAKNAKSGRQVVSYYDAGKTVKFKSNTTTWEMNPKAVVYHIETCNGGAMVNFSGNPHAINRKSNMSVPMGQGKNKLIVNDFKFNKKCSKIIFPEFYNKQSHLAFVDYPMAKSKPTKLKVLGKNEPIFRLAKERNGKYYAVSSGTHLEVYSKSGKKIVDKTLQPLKCSMGDKIFNIKFSPNSKYLATTQICGKLTLIDLQSGSVINETRTNVGLYDLDFAPDGTALVINAGLRANTEVSVLTADPDGSPFF